MSTQKPTQKSPRRPSQASEKARALREAAERRSKRIRAAVVAGTAVVVLALVVAVGLVVNAARPDPVDANAVPANVSDGGVVTGDAAAPVTVEVYLDYQCPACQQFEAANADYLDTQRAAGTVKVVYKPISILDRTSTTAYPTRAANAAACVADSSPADFAAWNDAMFAEQPAEGSAGLPDVRLVEIAQDAGAPETVADCITSRRYEGWVEATTQASSEDGVTGTPTVRVSGPGATTPITPRDLTQQALAEAVGTAAGTTSG